MTVFDSLSDTLGTIDAKYGPAVRADNACGLEVTRSDGSTYWIAAHYLEIL